MYVKSCGKLSYCYAKASHRLEAEIKIINNKEIYTAVKYNVRICYAERP